MKLSLKPSLKLYARLTAALGLAALLLLPAAFAQSPVKGYTKKLKSGKTVAVKGYTQTPNTAPKTTAVKGYTKTLKSGKQVAVKGYTRTKTMKTAPMAPKPGGKM